MAGCPFVLVVANTSHFGFCWKLELCNSLQHSFHPADDFSTVFCVIAVTSSCIHAHRLSQNYLGQSAPKDHFARDGGTLGEEHPQHSAAVYFLKSSPENQREEVRS